MGGRESPICPSPENTHLFGTRYAPYVSAGVDACERLATRRDGSCLDGTGTGDLASKKLHSAPWEVADAIRTEDRPKLSFKFGFAPCANSN